MTQITNAPEIKRHNSVDVWPNLLLTTFAALAPLLPLRAGKLSDSAPPPKAPTVIEIVDRSQHRLLLRSTLFLRFSSFRASLSRRRRFKSLRRIVRLRLHSG